MKVLYYSSSIARKSKEYGKGKPYAEYYSQCIASPQNQGRNSFSIPLGTKTSVIIAPFRGQYDFTDDESERD